MNKNVNYGNWVPEKMLALCYVAAAVLGIAAYVTGPVLHLAIPTWILGILAAICLVYGIYMHICHELFAFGKGNMMAKVHQHLVDHLEWDGEGTLLDIGCGAAALTIRCAKAFPKAKLVGMDYWGAEWNYAKEQCEANAKAEGVADRITFHKGDAAHANRQTNNFLEFLNNRDVPLPAVTELTAHCAGQPGHEAGQDALIQTIGCVELIQPFLIRFCARCLGQLHGHVLGKRAGQAAHHHIDDEGNAKQDHKRKQDTLDDVVSHLKNRSFLRGQGGRVFNGCAAWLQNTHEPGPCSFAYGVPKKSKI